MKASPQNHLKQRLVFIILGLVSTTWFLLRVIPRPSRATYPCMRAAAPFMSAFVIYLFSVLSSGLAFKLARERLSRARYATGILLFLAAVLLGGMGFHSNPRTLQAGSIDATVSHPPNQVMGQGMGLIPGRVVWAWDPEATNEECTNAYEDAYFFPHNNNQEVIDRMLSGILRNLTGESTDSAAWAAMFLHMNDRKYGKPDWGYVPYEKIFIKINATSTWGYPGGTYIRTDFTVRQSSSYIAETNPHVVLAVLRQLVNVFGVRQQDLWVGDPMKQIYQHAYELWYSEFPEVNYLSQNGGFGRIAAEPGSEAVLFYSDKGSVMPDAVSDRLYTVMEDAAYMINIPTLKAHARAGITLSAKNHFGSHTRGGAGHLHDGLVAPVEGPPTRTALGSYRVQVDLMGHELIGGNTMLVLVDGLYAGPEATWPPDKWNMQPFNGDWTSSLFASMDQVAVESVCFDFLRTEYKNKTVVNGRGGTETINFPNMAQGVDDYLEQAADPSRWPEGIVYDPEDDGEPLESLGAHEHWNGPESRQYSRNLGLDKGIELVGIPASLVEGATQTEQHFSAKRETLSFYPNPFSDQVNIRYATNGPSEVRLYFYNIQGKLVRILDQQSFHAGEHCLSWNGCGESGTPLPEGVYMTRMFIRSAAGNHSMAGQVRISR